MVKMGSSGGPRQGQETRPLVAFDFDGTITVRDSFTAFLRWRSGPWRYALGVVRLVPAALAYLVHRDRGRIKAAAAREFLRGLTRNELAASCEAYCGAVWGQMIRPDAEQCWRDWRARGATVVIVTASPVEVVGPFATRLGADELIGSRLAYDTGDRVTGALDGPNCRGEEKVTRLRQRFGSDMSLAAAYGDTAGDREMIAIAKEKGFRVFHRKP
jgi:phosphatidylglycerophosphatase C